MSIFDPRAANPLEGRYRAEGRCTIVLRRPARTDGLRGPRGCAEWAVVILGVIWVVLAIVFVVALIVRQSG